MIAKLFAFFVLVVNLGMMVHFVRESWRAFRSPEFRADVERLREQRRRRIAARRDLP